MTEKQFEKDKKRLFELLPYCTEFHDLPELQHEFDELEETVYPKLNPKEAWNFTYSVMKLHMTAAVKHLNELGLPSEVVEEVNKYANIIDLNDKLIEGTITDKEAEIFAEKYLDFFLKMSKNKHP